MPKPFEGLRRRLLEAGLAPSRVGRYLSELDDHLEDLVDAAVRAGASADEARADAVRRMGGPDTLAQAMLAHPEFRSLTARAPWLVLPTGALFGLAGGYILSLLFLVGAVRGCGIVTDGLIMPPAWLPSSSKPLFGFDHFALPVLIGWGIAFSAARQRLAVTWPLISMILVSIVGAGIVFSADWPATPRHWDVTIGTPLFDPALSMSWGDYAWSALDIFLCMIVPAGLAFGLSGGSTSSDPEGKSTCVR